MRIVKIGIRLALGAGWVLCALGCGGVQTGDGEFACNFKTDPWPELDVLPPTFSRSPRQMLAPLASPIEGRLLRSDGTSAEVRFNARVQEPTANVTYDSSRRTRPASCGGSVQAEGTLEALGSDISGSGPTKIFADDATLSLQFDSSAFQTTLEQREDSCAIAGIVLTLTLDESCLWHGDWMVAPPLASPTDGTACGPAPAPLGTFTAEGSCPQP